MKVYTVNEIVRSALLTTSKPIHYYMNYLHYALKAVKEIGFDSPFKIKSTVIAIDSNNEITLPDDFVDYIKVGWEKGQYVIKLIEKDSFNRLMNLDSEGNQIPYEDVESDSDLIYSDSHFYSSHGNDKSEHIGRHYGHKPTYKNSFMVIPERNKIMLDPSLKVGEKIVIDYITTGLPESLSDVTTLPAYAAEAVERYILWRFTEHDRTTPMNQKMMAKEEWIQAHKRYRSRNYQLSLDDILKSLRSHTFAAVKS